MMSTKSSLKKDFVDLQFAKVDIGREKRKGFPEVIYGEGKSPAQIVRIAQEIIQSAGLLLVSRASPEAFEALRAIAPSARYHPLARSITVEIKPKKKVKGRIAILCAGTSDLSVAEEAAVTAEVMGNRVDKYYDVGVAGINRLLKNLPKIRKAKVIIVVAGMDGALPSVVAGLVGTPVIAVPTSVGYGASFKGLAALLTMLNSCGSGVTVVNIDNGFGAAYAASQINHLT